MTVKENRRLVDKIVLITGAGSGFGRATSLRFAREGAKIIAVDRDLATAEATVALIKRILAPTHSQLSVTLAIRPKSWQWGKRRSRSFRAWTS